MNLFASIAAAAFAPIDATFGERLQVQHMLAAQFLAPSSDPAFPDFVVVGVLDIDGEVRDMSGRKEGDRSEIQTAQRFADIADAAFCAAQPAPVTGTILTALDRPGSPAFRVTDALSQDDGRTKYQVVPL